MRIYANDLDFKFECFTFPDGQPHFKLLTETQPREITIETAIRTPAELLQVILAQSVLERLGNRVALDVRYLLGARMDRAIDSRQPATLAVVARLLNSVGFSRVRLLDVHSAVSTDLIRGAVNVLPHKAFAEALYSFHDEPEIVAPDKGAVPRVTQLCNGPILPCGKVRNPETGALSGFFVPRRVGSNCLIVDDICDGGGTFVGLAAELRKAGARTVKLFVTHGIFSKGLPLAGIDHIYTTDSYFRLPITVDPDMKGFFNNYFTVIPVSMKEMP